MENEKKVKQKNNILVVFTPITFNLLNIVNIILNCYKL